MKIFHSQEVTGQVRELTQGHGENVTCLQGYKCIYSNQVFNDAKCTKGK